MKLDRLIFFVARPIFMAYDDTSAQPPSAEPEAKEPLAQSS